ncbi:hypothetical protein BDZ97DRAFT_1885186 [Flammula alnicola]|nr:hypothetical protein BDZ97DRAFT_1898433 [Flammula alnicola]KAF8951605.1 hypothetical protein BDZ97DRAFT_1885186 [Flammula alnicola]
MVRPRWIICRYSSPYVTAQMGITQGKRKDIYSREIKCNDGKRKMLNNAYQISPTVYDHDSLSEMRTTPNTKLLPSRSRFKHHVGARPNEQRWIPQAMRHTRTGNIGGYKTWKRLQEERVAPRTDDEPTHASGNRSITISGNWHGDRPPKPLHMAN